MCRPTRYGTSSAKESRHRFASSAQARQRQFRGDPTSRSSSTKLPTPPKHPNDPRRAHRRSRSTSRYASQSPSPLRRGRGTSFLIRGAVSVRFDRRVRTTSDPQSDNHVVLTELGPGWQRWRGSTPDVPHQRRKRACRYSAGPHITCCRSHRGPGRLSLLSVLKRHLPRGAKQLRRASGQRADSEL